MNSKVLVFLLFFMPLSITAQTGKLFDADKQLSSSFVSEVYLDRDGFIRVATRNGLNKYDGYQFRLYKKEKKAELGMASNYVNRMVQDRNGLFYVGMYGALQSFNGYRFKDVKVHDLQNHVMPPYVTCLLERENGEILIGTSGHGLVHLTDKENAHQMGALLLTSLGYTV